MADLVTIRHGQSAWNLENRFTGEIDVDLSPLGEEEATHAGLLIRSFSFDLAYTSVLKRAIRTLEIIMKTMGVTDLPVIRSASLNERNYGNLQGLNKAETEKKFGAAQVHTWRRSYDIAPPGGESLKDTYDRVIPYYTTEIEVKLKAGKNVLIVAHGNSLRALMMYLEHITPEKISDINIPTGIPRRYQFDDVLKIKNVSYLE